MEDVTSWRDAGAAADPHRLVIELSLDGPSAPSRLSVYLPGFAEPANDRSGLDLEAGLPDHLRAVEVGISARLEGCELPLAVDRLQNRDEDRFVEGTERTGLAKLRERLTASNPGAALKALEQELAESKSNKDFLAGL